jgi:predicted HTH domain antitoxin
LFFEEPSVPLINNFAEVLKMYNEKTLTFNKAAIMAGMNRYSFKKLIL